MRDSSGALKVSGSKDGKSTEHNIIGYAALNNFGRLNKLKIYVIAANKIKTFLLTSVWNGDYFYKGIKSSGEIDAEKVTGAQALGVLLLGSGYSSALSWAESYLGVKDYYGSQEVTGFDFNVDSNNPADTVWLEGTLQMALAYYKVNNSLRGDLYYNEAIKTTQGDGSLLLATNQDKVSEDWELEPWRAIAPTCWLIFYQLKFNPLILY